MLIYFVINMFLIILRKVHRKRMTLENVLFSEMVSVNILYILFTKAELIELDLLNLFMIGTL